MAKHLPWYCLALAFFSFSCEKSQVSPEEEAYAATYVLDKVEKETPQIHTLDGGFTGYAHPLFQAPPFTDDTLTTIRGITFHKKTLSEIVRRDQAAEKSYYSVNQLDKQMEFSPKFYGIYYTFNPAAPAVFTPATDQALTKAGLTMKADLEPDGLVLTKYVLAFKSKGRLIGKVDENYLDPAMLSKLKEGDTLITMKYLVRLKRAR
ncbi:MAG: hypothetical protein ACO1O1_11685 [Adhaeribacter sp.]